MDLIKFEFNYSCSFAKFVYGLRMIRAMETGELELPDRHTDSV